MRIIYIADKIEIGFWFLQGKAIIKITPDAIRAVQVDIGGGLSAFGIGDKGALNIIHRGARIDRGKYDVLVPGVKGRIEQADTMGELRFQIGVSRHIVDIVVGSGKRLQLGRAGCPGPAGIIKTKPLVPRKRIGEIGRRR